MNLDVVIICGANSFFLSIFGASFLKVLKQHFYDVKLLDKLPKTLYTQSQVFIEPDSFLCCAYHPHVN